MGDSFLFLFDPEAKEAEQELARLRRKLVFWFEKKGAPSDDAEDLADETLTAAIEASRKMTFDSKERLVKYIWGIAKNKLNLYWRQKSRDQVIFGPPREEKDGHSPELTHVTGEDPGDIEVFGEELDQELYHRCLHTCLARLKESDQEIMMAFANDGYGYAKVLADKLRMTENAIHSRKNRAMKQLQACFHGCIQD